MGQLIVKSGFFVKESDGRNTSAICCWIEELTETNKPINTLKKWKVFWNKELHAVFAGEKIAPQVYPRRLGQSSRSYLSRVPLAIEALWQNIDLVTNCAGLNSVNHKKMDIIKCHSISQIFWNRKRKYKHSSYLCKPNTIKIQMTRWNLEVCGNL